MSRSQYLHKATEPSFRNDTARGDKERFD